MDDATYQANMWKSLCTRYLRMHRYESRLIKEGFIRAREEQLGVVIPRDPNTDAYDLSALIELAKPRLPSLYRRAQTLRTQLHRDLDLLASQDRSQNPHRG